MKIIFLACLLLCFTLAGCGSSNDGELNTSIITATVDNSVLNSDVVAGVNCSTAVTTAPPAGDYVLATIKSTPYSNTGTVILPFRVESATISYERANTATPAMASTFQTVGLTVDNGASITVPIEVVTPKQKTALESTLGCTKTTYEYYARITFSISEIGTDKKTVVSSSVQLRLADL